MVEKQYGPIIEILRESPLFPPLVARAPKEDELTELLETGPIKNIAMADSAAALAKETLLSKNFTRCAPMLITDCLNKYAMLLHIDANLEQFSQRQINDLHFFPQGFYRVVIVHNKNKSIRKETLEHFIRTSKPNSILDIQWIDIETRGRYDVIFSPKKNQLAVIPEIDDMKALIVDSVRVDLPSHIPELKAIADSNVVPIAKTFFS